MKAKTMTALFAAVFAILKAFGMELKPQLYTRGEIREMKATASPF